MEAEALGPSGPSDAGTQGPTGSRGQIPIGGILSLVGGALLVVGSFLDWAEVSGTGTSVTAAGTDGTDGWITLVAGGLALAAGAAIMRRTGGRGAAVLAIVAGLIGGGVGLYDVTAKDSFALGWAAEELASEFGGSVEQLRALLDAAVDIGELAVTVAIGLYLVIAGGVLAIVGGGVALGRASAAPAPGALPEAVAEQPPPEAWASPSSGSPPRPPPPPATLPPSPWAPPEPSEREQPEADEDGA